MTRFRKTGEIVVIRCCDANANQTSPLRRLPFLRTLSYLERGTQLTTKRGNKKTFYLVMRRLLKISYCKGASRHAKAAGPKDHSEGKNVEAARSDTAK
jgi:hypothetical protein